MSPQAVSMVAAAFALVGLWAAWRAVRPRHVTIAEIQQRLQRVDVTRSARSSNSRGALAKVLARGPIGRFVNAQLGAGLALAEVTVVDVMGRVIAGFFIGVVTILIVSGALAAVGGGFSLVWVVLALLLGAIFALMQISQVSSLAQRRRRELRRTVNDFVQLIAVALTTNRSVEEAIRFAADAGEGYSWDLLRRTVQSAEPMGVPVWQALATMAETYDIPELFGLAGSLERQADIGISVADTVRAEAKSLRERQLTDLAEDADKANSNLSLPTMGMVFGMVAFIGYPVVVQISQAFTQ
jgi:Flp pilus assembly protein TadB